MDKEAAIKATKNGAIAACVSAVFTIFVIAIAIGTDTDGDLALWNDPLVIVDVILILICAFGIYKKSRVAAVLLFIYFIAAKIIITIEMQRFTGLGIGLIFLYFYGRAIQGAFVYHRIEKQENPDYKATSKWWYFLGIPSVLLTLLIIVFSLLSTTGVVPSTKVLAQDEINQDVIQTLQGSGIISSYDEVVYFYSQGLSSILESGNLLTQDRVIFYLTDENNEIQVYELFYDEITSIELEHPGSSISDSIYLVSTNYPDRWIKLFLSAQQKGDKKFVDELKKRISVIGI